FEVNGLGGAVLPGLPNPVGIVASGPKLAYDGRNANIRLAEGDIKPGLKYTVVAASLPTVAEIRNANASVVNSECTPGVKCSEYLKMPTPPAAVASLLAQAPKTSPWDTLDFLRQYVLNNIVASGQGVPVGITPGRVQEILSVKKEATPYEFVAIQAMLARWAGIPGRIGYGFDGGDKKGDSLEVHPKHGTNYLEVFFPTYKWVPVIGTPKQAKTSFSNDPQQFNADVAAINDVAAKLFIPVALDAKSFLYAEIRHALTVLLPIVLLLLMLYYSYPAIRKVILRSKRRTWAHHAGPKERIAVAYADWRDLMTDFGYRQDADTPLMFLDRVVEDDEHTELAWLVTRTLWGDLKEKASHDDAAAAEELSKSLRKRLSQGHSFTLKAVAAVSRLSIRYSYAPTLVPITRKERKDDAQAA
ncbi:MAG: transglutaminase-like domain-containing protein, partial [Actinobacteria bacterium]|nr:transglutaminase-like domain-containing protein [Actinomycetota bacterium]